MIDATGWAAIAAGAAAIAAFFTGGIVWMQMRYQALAYRNSIRPELVLYDWRLIHNTEGGRILIGKVKNHGQGPASNIKVKCKIGVQDVNDEVYVISPDITILPPGEETTLNTEINFWWHNSPDGQRLEAIVLILTVSTLDIHGNEHQQFRRLWVDTRDKSFIGEGVAPGITIIDRFGKILSAPQVRRRNQRERRKVLKSKSTKSGTQSQMSIASVTTTSTSQSSTVSVSSEADQNKTTCSEK